MSFFESPDGDDTCDGLVDEGIKCLDCGTRFVRSQGFVGNYCEACRYEARDIDNAD